MKTAKIILPLLLVAFGITFTLTNCKPDDNTIKSRTLNSAALTQDYSDLVHKANKNAFSDSLVTTNERIALGRVLFYDVKLSRNNAVACGSCHKQQYAFADNVAKSNGFMATNARRNSPAIQNLSQVHRLFWDGRADSIRQLVFMPIQDHIEMGFENIDLLPAKLASTDYYPALFQSAFGSATITKDRIGIALSNFIQILRSDGSKFDQSQPDPAVFFEPSPTLAGLTPSENLGFRTFIGKGRCNSCHNIGIGGSNGNFGHSYGMSEPDNTASLAVGTNTGLDMVYADKGEMNLTGIQADEGRFLIPGLRNIELTAPYMHDGRFKTLDEVIEFYDNGIKAHPNLSVKLRDLDAGNNNLLSNIVNAINEDNGSSTELFIDAQDDAIFASQLNTLGPIVARKLNLTPQEKQGLKDFLRTFTDSNFIHDQRLSDPFVVKYE